MIMTFIINVVRVADIVILLITYNTLTIIC